MQPSTQFRIRKNGNQAAIDEQVRKITRDVADLVHMVESSQRDQDEENVRVNAEPAQVTAELERELRRHSNR
jgi:hypothetical protein